MTDDPFATDHFMDLVAGATGTLYPSPGAMRWANRLAEQYGEERTSAALRHVMKDPRVQRHQTLSAAEQLLQYAATRDELASEREKEGEVAQAREDRSRREVEYQRDTLARASTDPRPLREIMGEMPWLRK